MRMTIRCARTALAFVVAVLINVPADAMSLVGLTSSGAIIRFDSATPGTLTSGPTIITGLQSGELIAAIDYRPATGMLYGLSNQGRIYTINPSTGTVTLIGAPGVSISGSEFGFDVNPVPDRLRITTNSGQNMRVHPDTGALAGIDSNLVFGAGDVHAGASPTIVGSAYTNSVAGAGITTLYGIDANFDALVRQNPPNAGELTTVGSLGVNTSSVVGFDIEAAANVAFAALEVGGVSSLYTISLATGEATLVGAIGFAQSVRGLAVAPGAWVVALTTSGSLFRFDSRAPSTLATVPTAITGLLDGESIIAIDYRPSTGGLYGVSNLSRLYTINLASGAAVEIGSSFSLFGDEFGFDFNPVADRIRITSDAGQNIRVNPNTGALAGTDGALEYAAGDAQFGFAPSIVGSAYINNVAGAGTTTLYGIDGNFNTLVVQNPPNAGTLTTIGNLGVDPSSVAGFDIEPATNVAYAALEVAGNSSLYIINLSTGAATPIGPIGSTEQIRGIAIVLFGAASTPGVVDATAASSAQINVSWSRVPGAEYYEVYRRAAGGSFTLVATTVGLTFADASVTNGAAYVYTLRAFSPSDGSSAFSEADLATARLFTDDPLVQNSTTIRAVHLTEVRAGIDAVRVLAGLGGATVTDADPAGVAIKSVHITELRDALDAARVLLQLPARTYTNSAATGTAVRAADLTELRNGIK